MAIVESYFSPTKVFVSYAHEDEEHKDKLLKQLRDLSRRGVIKLWYDRCMVPGAEWLADIREAIDGCDIAVLLVSDDFLDSDFIYSEELSRLVSRHDNGHIHVFPIIVRPCRWKASQIGVMQVVPMNGRAITTFPVENGERDQVWTEVANTFAALVDSIPSSPAARTIAGAPVGTTTNEVPVGKMWVAGERVGAMPIASDSALNRHYSEVMRALTLGRLVVFLGAEINCCEHTDVQGWVPSRSDAPPSDSQLAHYLAVSYGFAPDEAMNLVHVSQLVALRDGTAPLYGDLHEIYDADFRCTGLHRSLAAIPAALRKRGIKRPPPLLVSVNYDDLMERAYSEAGEAYDVVCYLAEGEHQGHFLHSTSEGVHTVIERPNEYARLPLDTRPIILKLQGTVDREQARFDSFVITEDHYISYISQSKLTSLLPANLITCLLRGQFLFLGHRLRDWHLRVIVQRLFDHGRLRSRSWAVCSFADPLDREFWSYYNVSVVDRAMEDYVADLDRYIAVLVAPDAGRAAQ